MSSENVREVLGRKRTVEILELLSSRGFQNYSEIESTLDTSTDTLSDSLSILVDYELVERKEESKKNVRYRITERGEQFLEVVQTLEKMLSETGD